VSSYHAGVSARARRAAAKKQRDDAFRMCMLSVRGRFDPPNWALQRLSPGDLAEYRTALAEAREKQRQEKRA
jgi:hypothetical protein